MKQVLYKSFFLILFICIIVVISGAPASKACDNKTLLRKINIEKQLKPTAEPEKDFPDLILGASIFQI